MTKETVTKVSSADFGREPQPYLTEAATAGHVVEVTAPSGDNVVILSKQDFEDYKATVELLRHPEDREAIVKSLAELAARPAHE
jgi:prevent-host-death family protein